MTSAIAKSAPLACLLLLTGAPAAQAERPSPAAVDSLLAASADTTLALKQRRNLAEKAVNFDRTGRAMHALARLYMSDWNAAAPDHADRWLLRAVEREPENAEYRATRAEMFWRWDRRDDALSEARQALDLDPDCIPALYWAGRYKMDQMTRFIEAERDSGMTSLRGFGEEDRDAAIGYLTRAVTVAPEHRPSRILLGLVYYEGKMPGELVGLFEDHLKRHPDDRDACFFTGLGYQSQKDLEKANRAYLDGLARMSGPERAFVESVFMLTDRKAREGAHPDSEAVRRFWAGRDPLFLTPVNERLLEHCRRVAYANLRYSDPMKGIEGWETDRGQAYIRYGQPLIRTANPAEVDMGTDLPIAAQQELARRAEGQGRMPVAFHNRVEIWDYDGFRVVFENPDTRDAYRFKIARVGDSLIYEFSTLTARLPEYYADPNRWKRYTPPLQIAQFRAEGDSTRVEVYYALPAEEITHWEITSGIHGVDLRQGLFLFDAAWKEVRREVRQVERMPYVTFSEEGYLYARERLSLTPGDYTLCAKAEDQKTGSIGSVRDTLRVRRFGSDALEVSDLLLARRVVERPEGPSGRDRFSILPNPVGKCRRGDQAAFYFEVYNLARDATGNSRYQTTYQVLALAPAYAGDEGNKTSPEWVTAVSSTLQGSQPWEPRYLALDLAKVAPGLRTFRVVVTDLLNGQKAIASAAFRVTW